MCKNVALGASNFPQIDCFFYIYICPDGSSFFLFFFADVSNAWISCYSLCWLRKACNQRILIVTSFLSQVGMKHTRWCVVVTAARGSGHGQKYVTVNCDAQEGRSELSHVLENASQFAFADLMIFHRRAVSICEPKVAYWKVFSFVTSPALNINCRPFWAGKAYKTCSLTQTQVSNKI